jgi:hypothetical protein
MLPRTLLPVFGVTGCNCVSRSATRLRPEPDVLRKGWLLSRRRATTPQMEALRTELLALLDPPTGSNLH